MSQNFLDCRSKLSERRDINTKRIVLKTKQTDAIDVGVFCDASKIGFGDKVYGVTQNEQCVRGAFFLTVKAKVAPKKAQSYHCLDFCAAKLGSNLISRSQKLSAR